MKLLNAIIPVGALGIAILGFLMVKTNPEENKYEDYAVQRLSKYLKDDVCRKTPKFLESLIKVNCSQLIDSANPHIREMIVASSERQNYVFFSIYQTEMKLDSFVPSYKFETLGVFDRFYTYVAEKQ
jgi:hypothetical protein